MEPAAQFDPTRGNLPGPDNKRIDRLKIFLDLLSGGAWPFLAGGVICLVYSVNERDLDLLTSPAQPARVAFFGQTKKVGFLKGLSVRSRWKFEAITGL